MKIENKSETDYFVTKNKRTPKKPRKQRKDNWSLKFAVFVYLILPGIILSIVISMAFKVSDRTLYDFTQWYISFPITGFIVGLFLLFRHHILHSDEINYKDFIQWKYSLSLIWMPTVGALFISPILIGGLKWPITIYLLHIKSIMNMPKLLRDIIAHPDTNQIMLWFFTSKTGNIRTLKSGFTQTSTNMLKLAVHMLLRFNVDFSTFL